MESTIAILMADLTGYTAMTEIHGGESAAKIVQRYMCLVDGALVGSAKVIQRIGDQVVITSDNVEDVFQTALRLDQLTCEEHQFLAVHAGLHYGQVFIEGNNLFGSTINIASRIMNLAERGQILCSQTFIAHLGRKSAFRSIGEQKLKNVMGVLELFELNREGRPVALFVDPVCHMQVDSLKAHYNFAINNNTYHFCSEHCQALFKKDPSSFLAECK